MDQEFLFRPTSADPAALLAQVSRALEQFTERNARRDYPGMWNCIDRLNAFNERTPTLPRGLRVVLYVVLYVVFTLAGLLLFTTFLMDPAAFLFPGLLGAAAYFWGLFRLYRFRRWSVLPILALHGILSAVSGFSLTQDEGSGKWLLCTGVAELVLFLGLLLFPRRPKKATSFERAAASLLESRSKLSADENVTILFTPDHMEVSGTDPVPYARFDGIFETEDILLCIFDEKAMVLQKSELASGAPSDLHTFLAQRVTLIET